MLARASDGETISLLSPKNQGFVKRLLSLKFCADDTPTANKAIHRLKPLSRLLTKSYDESIQSIGALALVETGVFASGAYPDLYKKIYPTLMTAGLILCLGHGGLTVAAEKKAEIKIGERVIKIKEIHHYLNGLINGANTFNFTLASTIAVYIVALALIRHIGENDVYVSDKAYIGGFLIPSALIGSTHTMLDWFKPTWSNSPSRWKKWTCVSLHKSVETLLNASNVNSFMNLCGLNEAGKMNPYSRVGLFALAASIGLLSTLVSSLAKATKQPITRIINTLCVVSYLANLLAPESKKLLKDDLFFLSIGTLISISLCYVLINGLALRHSTPRAKHSLFEPAASSEPSVSSTARLLEIAPDDAISINTQEQTIVPFSPKRGS